MKVRKVFDVFAREIARYSGHPLAFIIAVGSLVVWAVLGPHYHYSDTWQLVINTSTSVITFLMVFLIQNAQNRDSVAIQTKLDELIRALGGARNEMIGLEDLSEEELAEFHRHFSTLAETARTRLTLRKEASQKKHL